MAAQSMAPKLPSPLQEMHRIKIQLQHRDDGELLGVLEPYYSEAVGNYLSQMTNQANNSAHPAMLPTVLEGLDTLLQVQQEPSLENSIRYTYKTVFQSYLKLINPNVSAGSEPQTRSSKRKAKAIAANEDGDGKKGENNDLDISTAV